MKNYQINSDHSMFSLSTHVADFANEFLKGKDLSYFQFARYYRDGSILPLLNRANAVKEGFDHGYGSYSSLKEEDKTKASYSFMWDEELPEDPVSFVRAKCQIHHGMTILRRSRDHYDMIGFARNEACHSPGGFYLSRLKALDEFTFSFEEAFKAIFKDPTPHLLHPPLHQQDVNCLAICMGESLISVQGRQGMSHITPREAECVQLWARNFSYKEIADRLDLSPRTVETLFNRSRARTGLTLKQLVRQLIICP